jgi:CubicO group peptidase (beta-lactamase class C family)
MSRADERCCVHLSRQDDGIEKCSRRLVRSHEALELRSGGSRVLLLALLNFRIAARSLAVFSMTTLSANAGQLPERVDNAAQERIAAGTYQTLVFGVVNGDKSEVVSFGKLGDDKAPDPDTVYEIGSVTKMFTATLLAQAVLSGRVTLDTRCHNFCYASKSLTQWQGDCTR